MDDLLADEYLSYYLDGDDLIVSCSTGSFTFPV